MKTKLQRAGKRVCKQYTASERRNLVDKYKRSGLTKTAFCRENDITLTNFSNWIKPCNRKKCETVEFAEVEFSVPVDSGVSVEITFPDGKVLRLRNFQMTKESATFIRRMASC